MTPPAAAHTRMHTHTHTTGDAMYTACTVYTAHTHIPSAAARTAAATLQKAVAFLYPRTALAATQVQPPLRAAHLCVRVCASFHAYHAQQESVPRGACARLGAVHDGCVPARECVFLRSHSKGVHRARPHHARVARLWIHSGVSAQHCAASWPLHTPAAGDRTAAAPQRNRWVGYRLYPLVHARHMQNDALLSCPAPAHPARMFGPLRGGKLCSVCVEKDAGVCVWRADTVALCRVAAWPQTSHARRSPRVPCPCPHAHSIVQSI